VKLNCTLDERPATASLHSATPKRKNVPCFFVFSRGDFSFDMERTFFFLVFCPEVSGQVSGRKRIPSRPSVHSSETHRAPVGARLVSLAFPLFRIRPRFSAHAEFVLRGVGFRI
jgi:hypothetical protein